jgi:hypothetical protein
VSTLDDDGCGWICVSRGCPEPAAGELEAEDLAGAGVSTSAGTGSDVEDEALAGRLARLNTLLLELGRLAEGAGALAAHLSDVLIVSHHSDDFDEAQDARQALAAAGALCAVLRRTAGDAQDHLAGVDPELPALLTISEV